MSAEEYDEAGFTPFVLPHDAGELARAAGALEHPSLNGSQPGERDSWTPINLADPRYAVPPDPPTIMGLLYTGKRHVISGPPESAKTLIAYTLLLTAIRDSRRVAIIDFEMGAAGARRLLDDLGATIEEVAAIYYVEPDQAPQDELQHLIGEHPELVLIDAAVGAYDASDLDDNARKDAERFARTWIRPLWQQGIATLLIDHVTKNADTRGKFTIGSERKIGQSDVHLSLEALKPLSRGNTGMVKVTVHKDRPGFLQRPTACTIDLTSHPDTHSISWEVRAPDASDPLEFRPTFQMERVSRYLEMQSEPVSRTQVETSVKGKSAKALRQALDALAHEGYTVEKTGLRGARLVTSIKPYRQSESVTSDDLSDDNRPRPAHEHSNQGVTNAVTSAENAHLTPSDPVRPRLDGVNPPRLTPSPLLRDGGRGDAVETSSPRLDGVVDEEAQYLIDKYGLKED